LRIDSRIGNLGSWGTTKLIDAAACGIAVTDEYVYWTEGCATEDTPNGTIKRLNVDDALAGVGVAETVVGGLASPAKLLVAFNYVYWTDWRGVAWIARHPAGPLANLGAVTNVWPSYPVIIVNHCAPVAAVSNQTRWIYWSDDRDLWVIKHEPGQMQIAYNLTTHPDDWAFDIADFTVAGGHLFYTRWHAGMVMKRPIKTFGSPTPSATMLYATYSSDVHTDLILVDGAYVYWSETGGGGSIKRVSTAGGAAAVVGSNLGQVDSMAILGNNIFWIANGALHSRPKDGSGSTSQIATGVYGELKVSGSRVFWGGHSGIFVYE